jgi:methionine synthase II (cobalamin-independent)
MMIQFLEGLPGVHFESGRIVILSDAEDFEDQLLAFYEEYLAVDDGTKSLDGCRFQLGPESGRTFFRFLEAARDQSPQLAAVKGQVVGPFTLLAGLKDSRDRAILYDERLQDVATKHLAMKCRWQIRHLQSLDCPVIVFLDEPALAGFGSSAFISVDRDLIHRLLQEVVDAVHAEGALAGIHVCANTDWAIAFESGLDIINFDAYSHFDRFALYRDEIRRFLGKGGNIAWGIVPTDDPASVMGESTSSLVDRWFENIKDLVTSEYSVERILTQSLFTPSCGCGSLPEDIAERVLDTTREVSEAMQTHL